MSVIGPIGTKRRCRCGWTSHARTGSGRSKQTNKHCRRPGHEEVR